MTVDPAEIEQAPAPSEGKALTWLRRIPFTVASALVIVVMGFVTQAWWSDLDSSRWWHRLAYGLPAIEDGRWWTPLAGSVVAHHPLEYIPVLGVFVFVTGLCELRLGTRTVALATVGGQLFGILGASGLFAALRPTGWDWAVARSHDLDVGSSAGLFCTLIITVLTLRAPWRGRFLVATLGYCVVSLLWVGFIWDVEHFLGAALGVAIGLCRRGPDGTRPRPDWRRPKLTRHEARIIASGLFLLIAFAQLAALVYPNDGPLGGLGNPPHQPILIVVVIAQIVIAGGLHRGSRVAWRFAVGLVVVGLLSAIGLRPAARSVAGALLYVPLLYLIVRTRNAYSAPLDRYALRRLLRDVAVIVAGFLAYVFIGFATSSNGARNQPRR